MAKRTGGKPSMRKYVRRFIAASVSLIVFLNIENILMTWLTQKLLSVQNVYLDSEIRFLGTTITALLVVLIMFAVMYRRRKRELTTLSDSIDRVAGGDYAEKITFSQKDSMAHVYRNFNKMTAELENVAFLKKDFINNFSHEFKTPIASINGFASLMLEKDLPREAQLEYLAIIRDETERLSKLTSNTILLSKLSSREVIEDVEEYDLGEQLRQCAIILSPQWLGKQQEFECEFPKILYSGNRELMQHMWLNIMGNSVKYTPEKGKISAYLVQEEGTVRMSIKDNGAGMDEQTQKHLFEPYYQGNLAHSGQGLGLGLSIAKKIAQLCGGKIEVNSEIGKGSEFIVSLPL